MKFTTEVFDIAGRKVEITRVPPRMRKSIFRGDETLKAEEQALFEVRIDGDFVARAVRPFGVGKMAFRIEKLYDGHDEDLGDNVAYGRGYLPMADRLLTLDRVAAKVVEIRDTSGRHDISNLPTVDEYAAHVAARSQRKAAERSNGRARDKQEKLDRIKAREEEDAHFRDVIDGLTSIDERLSGHLNNYEINALRIAIAKYEKDRDTVLSHRAAFEDDEFRGR
ncbi:hypothetical protein GOB57_24755 [Sinorhizobium meliloti]|nr:hypothetical protein [Sinorhizobium meliloti]